MMNTIIETLCKIPEEIGWAMVGACAMFVAVMIKTFIGYAIEYFRPDEEDEEE